MKTIRQRIINHLRAANFPKEIGYVLIGFVTEVDGYHWKAVYVKTENLPKALRSGE